MTSFGEVLDGHRGIGPGFDFARVALAISVVAYHSPQLAYGSVIDTTNVDYYWIAFRSVLPMFFGLSGFLVAGSAQRLSLRNFLVNRGFRIVPALGVEVILSALVLGPLLTIYSLRLYFNDSNFYIYFLNMIGFVNYRLPGVFLGNPVSNIVNGSLWTVPHEIICYVVISCAIVSGAVRSATAYISALAIIVILSTLTVLFVGPLPKSQALTAIYERWYAGGYGPLLLPCFLLGGAAYVLRFYIPYDWRLLAVCLGTLCFSGVMYKSEDWLSVPFATTLCLPIVYVVCFLGMTRIPKIPIYRFGDYSYGVYLYGYPIQQTLISLFPSLRTGTAVFFASWIASTAFAIVSWHLIEKPVLRLRKRYSLVAQLENAREEKA